MMISIVTATYNRFESLKILYESIKAQTYKDWEWVIVDDHSNIITYRKLKELFINDSRVRLFRNATNEKQAYTRNKAIKLAKGDIITNIDSDDDIPIKRLEIINESFTREPDCDILYGGWTLIKGPKDHGTYFPPNPYKHEDFLNANRINNNTTAWKSSCNLFYDEDYPDGADDYSMWLCASTRGLKFMTADVNMVFWKQYEGCKGFDGAAKMNQEAARVKTFWSKPMISIIMPTYNRTKYLKQAIESVMRQTFTNWELLVVDDGSEGQIADEIIDIVNSFNDNRIRIFHKHNGGLSSALNFGLDRSEGDYIALLDDDDKWLCYHLNMLYKAIHGLNKENENEKRIGVVYGQTTVGKIRQDGDTIEVHIDNICRPFKDRSEFLQMNYLTTCSVLFEKKVVYDNGLYFDETFPTHMDWDFWLRLNQYVKFAYFPVRSSVYRIHKDNMMAHGKQKIIGVSKLSIWEDIGRVQMKHIKL